MVSVFINSMWTAPIVAICVGILLWIQIGFPGMIGILIVFIVVPIQSKYDEINNFMLFV